MKLCRTCQTNKPLSAFSARTSNPDGHQSKCKECHREYQKKHYRDNKVYYISKAGQYHEDMTALIREAKNKPCSDCGIKYEYFAMDFDHIGEKLMLMAHARKSGKQKILAEIEKCDVVCAVCHRYRTQSRLASVSPHPPKVLKA
jgi:hypothetical protein